MKRLIAFPLQDGTDVVVEVNDMESRGGITRGSRPTETIEKANTTFEEALSKVKPAAESVINTLRSLTVPADETTVQFGLKLDAAAGVVIASASVEANYTITMTWKRKEPAEGPPE